LTETRHPPHHNGKKAFVTALRQPIETAPDVAPPQPVGATDEPRLSFAQVYETHFPFVWRSALRLGTPEANVPDVVQDAFVVAYRRLPEFESRSSVRTWLFAILINVVRAHRRMLAAKQPHVLKGEPSADIESVADRSDGPDERAEKAEAARFVNAVLESLDEDKRAVFVLAELEQMSAPEIAAALGVPLNTVYSRLRLARQEFGEAAARLRARDQWRTR
jgi:RNA polymerase sigma-70 factor (ECF subfamily)